MPTRALSVSGSGTSAFGVSLDSSSGFTFRAADNPRRVFGFTGTGSSEDSIRATCRREMPALSASSC